MAPGRVVTCVARISSDGAAVGVGATPTTLSGLRALTAPRFLDAAADMLGRGSVDVIGYASTSSAYAIGFDAEAAVVSRLSQQVGIPVVATCASAVLALHLLDVERIALVDPPWFDPELNELGAAYFQSQGFDVLSSTSADLSRDSRRIEAAAVLEWVSRHANDDAEAVFIGGKEWIPSGGSDRVGGGRDRSPGPHVEPGSAVEPSCAGGRHARCRRLRPAVRAQTPVRTFCHSVAGWAIVTGARVG
jgi:Arylmalonate decarboxylase